MTTVFEGITIDPEKARDLDDAIWIERDEHGWTVKVAFPRFAHRVEIGGKVDQIALERIVTVYRGKDYMRPMVPMEIVDRASLTRGGNKDVFLVTIRVGREFEVVTTTCEQATFKNIGQLSYDLASDLVRTGRGEIGEMLGRARDLAYGLFEKRRASGAIAYYDLERGVAFDEEGAVILMTGEGHVAEMIVSEFMILANSCLAEWAKSQGIRILYRNHARRGSVTREQVLASLKGLSDNVDLNLETMPRLMGRATIGVQAEGHFGLNLAAYAWFTSPLRRYVDLVNQRMIGAHLTGDEAPYDDATLGAFAEAVNAKLVEDAERTSAHFRAQAKKAAEARILNGSVATASDQTFSRVVKVLSEDAQALTQDVEEESLRRLGAGTLTPKEVTRLMLLGGRLGEAVVARLVANPHESLSIMNYGASALGWSMPRFVDTSGGPPHARVFAATATVQVDGAEHTSPSVVRSSKKAAQHAAAVHLLASIAGVKLPPETKILAPAVIEPKAKASAEGVGGDNPRNRLQEFCAKRRWPLPVFDVTEHGPQATRTYHAVVTIVVNGQPKKSRPAKDRTRKGAEKAAAAAMLKSLASA